MGQDFADIGEDETGHVEDGFGFGAVENVVVWMVGLVGFGIVGLGDGFGELVGGLEVCF